MQDDSGIGPQAYLPLAAGALLGAVLGAIAGALLGGMLAWDWMPQMGVGAGAVLGILVGSRCDARRDNGQSALP